MKSYQDLLNEKEALDAQLEATRKAEFAAVVAEIRHTIELFDIKAVDLGFVQAASAASGSRKGTRVAIKYRDPQTGNTWTGRGKAPKWIAGKAREPFLV